MSANSLEYQEELVQLVQLARQDLRVTKETRVYGENQVLEELVCAGG